MEESQETEELVAAAPAKAKPVKPKTLTMQMHPQDMETVDRLVGEWSKKLGMPLSRTQVAKLIFNKGLEVTCRELGIQL